MATIVNIDNIEISAEANFFPFNMCVKLHIFNKQLGIFAGQPIESTMNGRLGVKKISIRGIFLPPLGAQSPAETGP